MDNSNSFDEVCKRAKDVSALHRCTVHVNATIEWNHDNPIEPVSKITGFVVDDWMADTTAASYTNGERV